MESKQSTPSFPYYGKPLFVGEFGTDHVNNTVKIGRSLLRYLYEPCLQQANISWDLKEGYSIWRQKPKVCFSSVTVLIAARRSANNSTICFAILLPHPSRTLVSKKSFMTRKSFVGAAY